MTTTALRYILIWVYAKGDGIMTDMTDYKKLYHLLFNSITDALEALGHLDVPAAIRLLEDAQVKAEGRILEEV